MFTFSIKVPLLNVKPPAEVIRSLSTGLPLFAVSNLRYALLASAPRKPRMRAPRSEVFVVSRSTKLTIPNGSSAPPVCCETNCRVPLPTPVAPITTFAPPTPPSSSVAPLDRWMLEPTVARAFVHLSFYASQISVMF